MKKRYFLLLLSLAFAQPGVVSPMRALFGGMDARDFGAIMVEKTGGDQVVESVARDGGLGRLLVQGLGGVAYNMFGGVAADTASGFIGRYASERAKVKKAALKRVKRARRTARKIARRKRLAELANKDNERPVVAMQGNDSETQANGFGNDISSDIREASVPTEPFDALDEVSLEEESQFDDIDVPAPLPIDPAPMVSASVVAKAGGLGSRVLGGLGGLVAGGATVAGSVLSNFVAANPVLTGASMCGLGAWFFSAKFREWAKKWGKRAAYFAALLLTLYVLG